MKPLLSVQQLSKSYGALKVTNDISFDIAEGELFAIIGPNGAGKTTLIHQLSGMLSADSGQILFNGVDVTQQSMPDRVKAGLARSFQITSILPRFTALENVATAIQARRHSSFRFFDRVANDEGLNEPARAILNEVGLDGRHHVPADSLSHGEKRQLEVAIALATQPKLLLLDEPLAGTSHDESRNITNLLRALKGRITIALIEHDMEAVFALADRVGVLVYGRMIAAGAPADIRANAEVRAAYLGEETHA
ncbi:ABC transporter ATP-binding protein [Undibacter mobilis]|uniref:ABC transporter ATP-binding protein n=1 Tax=Undibacter mobilis TaxID=2292256 RepID=UPI00143CEF1A|nr:ABC transporter ATP-binding protein [Undibacter mobilis]